MAFFIRPRLMMNGMKFYQAFGQAVIFLLHRERALSVTVGCPESKVAGKNQIINISGWNVPVQELKLNTKN